MEVLGKMAANRVALSEFLNTSQGLKLPLAWGAGVATAQDLARLFNILAFEGTYGGRTFISSNTQALISKPLNPPGSEDVILHWPVRWGLGFINGETPSIYGTVSHPQAIGHAGGGANVAWADPQQHLSVAFLCNGMRTGGEEWERYRILGDLIYEAVSSMNN
jgi:prepilin-type processing-associated H-X9-DG protein